MIERLGVSVMSFFGLLKVRTMSRRQVQVDGDYCSRAPRVGLIIHHNGNCGLFLKALTQGFRAERQKKNKQEASRVEINQRELQSI